MRISLSIVGNMNNYYKVLNEIGISLNDISIPAIGNPTILPHKRYDFWQNKMKENINMLINNGINIKDILINTPINQIIYSNINELKKYVSFIKSHNISKIIVIKGNENMGKAVVSLKIFIEEFKKETSNLNIEIYVALYPSHKLSWGYEK